MDKKEFEKPVIEEIEKTEDIQEQGTDRDSVEKTEVAPVQPKKKKDTKIDSVEDLNRMAAELKEAGDRKGLDKLAEQYSMDQEDVEDYLDGLTDEFATPLMAAVGKLKHEEKVLGIQGSMKGWTESVQQMCTDDEEFCRAVMKSDKKLAECMGKVLKCAFDKKRKVNDAIVKAAELDQPIYIGIPGKEEIKNLVMEYYMG